jgi:hypothetical protein
MLQKKHVSIHDRRSQIPEKELRHLQEDKMHFQPLEQGMPQGKMPFLFQDVAKALRQV